MDRKRLSASRIKVVQSCSWTYWCKYHLKLPEKGNDGARRGTICHAIFEYLGKGGKTHKAQLDKILKNEDAFASPQVKKKVEKMAKELGVDDDANMLQIKDMILVGLQYDFWGQNEGELKEAYSELVFDIDVKDGDLDYHIYGFLDKVFIYDNPKRILIRDFKTSKSVFTGKDYDDNQQNLLYRLAMYRKFGWDYDMDVEFLFLKFPMKNQDSKGVMRMPPVDRDEIEGYELFLTDIQKYLDNFDINDAMSHLAFYQKWPGKEDGFVGPLMCGFAKQKGQLKKDGTPMWHCPFKFDFEFVKIFDKNGKFVKSCFLDEFDEKMVPPHGRWEQEAYKGCPAYR